MDAGFGQLLGSLRQDERVVVLERTNVADLNKDLIDTPVDLITLDLSYLPIASAVGQLHRVPLASSVQLIALIKPMFELGLAGLPPPGRLSEAVDLAARGVMASGWDAIRVVESRVRGRHGAVEFFLHSRKRGADPGRGTNADPR